MVESVALQVALVLQLSEVVSSFATALQVALVLQLSEVVSSFATSIQGDRCLDWNWAPLYRGLEDQASRSGRFKGRDWSIAEMPDPLAKTAAIFH